MLHVKERGTEIRSYLEEQCNCSQYLNTTDGQSKNNEKHHGVKSLGAINSNTTKTNIKNLEVGMGAPNSKETRIICKSPMYEI